MFFNHFGCSEKNSEVVCTLLLILSLVLILPYVHSVSYEGKSTSNLPKWNSSTEDTQFQKGDQQPCCRTGGFYKTAEFDIPNWLITALGDEIVEKYGLIKLAYCTVVPIVDILLLKEEGDLCYCDCKYAHAARGYVVCSSATDIPCLCKYSTEDNPKIPTSECAPKGSKYMESPPSQLTPVPEHDWQPRERLDVGDDVCASLFSSVFICSEINNDGKDYYKAGGLQIFPTDICAFDCHYTHGSFKPPYGKCCNMADNSRKCVCVY